MSYALTAEHMRDFAEIAGIEFVHINKDTNVNQLREQLRWNDLAYKLGI
jgi:L-arabinose isomerase